MCEEKGRPIGNLGTRASLEISTRFAKWFGSTLKRATILAATDQESAFGDSQLMQ
jgi:hypothetical protein